MKIRAGYVISYDCPQPTPMILQLSVHPSRIGDLLTWDRMYFAPAIPVNTYHDSFGNFCHVIRAPAGRLTMSTDFLVQDNGEPDTLTPAAKQHPLEDLPVNVADLSARQPLLRDRPLIKYCVVAVRKDSEGMASGSGDLRLCPRPHHVQL